MGEMVTNWLAVSAQDWKFWEFKPCVMSLKTILKSFTHLASQMCKKECLIARERAEGVVRVTCWRMAQRPILSSEGRESFISFHFSPKYYSFQFHPAFFVVVSFLFWPRNNCVLQVDWGLFSLMSLPTILIPFLVWFRSHSKYENFKAKKN